jgi:hypothetical protein
VSKKESGKMDGIRISRKDVALFVSTAGLLVALGLIPLDEEALIRLILIIEVLSSVILMVLLIDLANSI